MPKGGLVELPWWTALLKGLWLEGFAPHGKAEILIVQHIARAPPPGPDSLKGGRAPHPEAGRPRRIRGLGRALGLAAKTWSACTVHGRRRARRAFANAHGRACGAYRARRALGTQGLSKGAPKAPRMPSAVHKARPRALSPRRACAAAAASSLVLPEAGGRRPLLHRGDPGLFSVSVVPYLVSPRRPFLPSPPVASPPSPRLPPLVRTHLSPPSPAPSFQRSLVVSQPALVPVARPCFVCSRCPPDIRVAPPDPARPGPLTEGRASW